MNRGKLTFICVWLAVFAVAYLIWALYLGVLTRSLVKYEGYGPETAAADVFTEYFASADAEKLAGYGEFTLSPYDKTNAASEFLALIIDGKAATYYEVGELTYEVASGGVVFARFSVVEDTNAKALFGRYPYKLGKITLIAEPSFKANIIAPKNASVKVNGVLLTEADQTGEYITLDDAPYFPENDPDARIMAVYRIEGLYVAPDITVESADGSVSYGVEYDRQRSEYDAEYSYRAHLSEIYNKTIFG